MHHHFNALSYNIKKTYLEKNVQFPGSMLLIRGIKQQEKSNITKDTDEYIVIQ